MTTEYRVRLDRTVCDGVFACLVRDDRFVEAPDGLATIGDGHRPEAADDVVIESFADDRVDQAKQAARACPVDAINVMEVDRE